MSSTGSASRFNRRELLLSTAATALGTALPATSARATAPPPVLRLGVIGLGGQSGGDLPNIVSHPVVKIVAVCDVDREARERCIKNLHLDAPPQFSDYRHLLRAMWGDLDAVYVATPDHMHAPIGLASIAKGLHIYLQKPLARSVGECRALRLAAAKQPHLATQMGIQIHAEPAYRTAVKWLRAGMIGKVSEIHTFCAKGWGGASPAHAPDPIPDGLEWDLYCGVSPHTPYIAGYYHPSNWRKWRAFGTGTLGDMACHIFDPVFSGLALGVPTSVLSHGDVPPTEENFAYNAHIEWGMRETPFTTKTPALHWYHGDTRPPKEIAPEGVDIPGSGSLLIGENGKMIIPHWAIPTVYGKDGRKVEHLPEPEKASNHYHEWVNVATGVVPGPCGAHFGYAAPMTEVVLLGNIAGWWPNKTLNWDAAAGRFTGEDASTANSLVLPVYRDAWEVPFINV